jgi:hypothetical protein
LRGFLFQHGLLNQAVVGKALDHIGDSTNAKER